MRALASPRLLLDVAACAATVLRLATYPFLAVVALATGYVMGVPT